MAVAQYTCMVLYEEAAYLVGSVLQNSQWLCEVGFVIILVVVQC